MTVNSTNRYKFKKVLNDFRETICAQDAHIYIYRLKMKNHYSLFVVFPHFFFLSFSATFSFSQPPAHPIPLFPFSCTKGLEEV